MTATGLSTNPQEYRERLEEQPDQQIDCVGGELMRDMSIRLGVREVLRPARGDGHRRHRADELYTRRRRASGGLRQDRDGEMMVPAISLYYFVTGRARDA